MRIEASSPDEYISKIPDDQKKAMNKLRKTIIENLPAGFEETMSYGMIGYVVPKSIYPNGYHCNPELPLPFMNIASQKNFIALYHNGLYADEKLMNWFKEEYPKHSKLKPYMGKSCMRFKKTEDIPFDLIADLSSRITADEWIQMYEGRLKK